MLQDGPGPAAGAGPEAWTDAADASRRRQSIRDGRRRPPDHGMVAPTRGTLIQRSDAPGGEPMCFPGHPSKTLARLAQALHELPVVRVLGEVVAHRLEEGDEGVGHAVLEVHRVQR